MVNRINIVGWSPYRKAGGVTGHVLAMSEMAAAYFGKSVDVRADHFGPRPIENYIWNFRRTLPISEHEDFYSGPDYPDYMKCILHYEATFLRRLKSDRVQQRLTVKGHEAYAFSSNMKLLKPVTYAWESVFDGGTGEVCFVDSSGKNSPYSFKGLQEADLIMVFLPENPVEIRKFFHLYSYFINKSFFIINKFSQNECFVLDIMKRLGVPMERVGRIPYSPELARACLEHTVDNLIYREIGRKEHTEYFRRIKDITKRVLIEGRIRADARLRMACEQQLVKN